ncbi:MAG: hypothetical protein ABEJ70_00955 [Halobacteriaceae archaeon]
MERRTFLAALLAVTAGCGGGQTEPRTTTSTRETTATTESTTVTTTSTATPTTTGTTETTTATTEATTTTTTAEENYVARLRIDEARGALGDALEAYTATTDGGVLDVTPADTPDLERVRSRVEDARAALDEAEAAATESQRRTVADLRVAATFLERAATADRALTDAHAGAVSVRERLPTSLGIGDALRRMRAALETARAALADLSPVDGEAASALDGLGDRVVERKRTQVRERTEGYGTTADACETFGAGMSAFGRGTDDYRSDAWRNAAEFFATAADRLGQASEAYDTVPEVPALSDVLAVLAPACAALATAAERAEVSARAGEDERESDRKAELESAKDAVRGNEYARRFQTVVRFLDSN